MKKIIGILVLMLLLGISILPIVTINGKVIEESHFLSKTQLTMAGYIHVKGIDGESKGPSVGLRITIGNSGSVPMNDIDWTFDAEGGTIIFGDGVQGNIPMLDAGEETHIFLRPGHFILQNADGQSPIGVGRITLMATAKTSTDTLEITEDEFLIGPIIYFY
jgi:uncharacterized membrane protein